jgi:hypothetical protein
MAEEDIQLVVDREWALLSFPARSSAQQVDRLIYISNRHGRRARRSSLWRRAAGAWRLLFHQGTPLNDT